MPHLLSLSQTSFYNIGVQGFGNAEQFQRKITCQNLSLWLLFGNSVTRNIISIPLIFTIVLGNYQTSISKFMIPVIIAQISYFANSILWLIDVIKGLKTLNWALTYVCTTMNIVSYKCNRFKKNCRVIFYSKVICPEFIYNS